VSDVSVWLTGAYVECRRRDFVDDPAQFFRECVWVENPSVPEGRVLLDLYDYQLDDLDLLLTEDRLLILKARQLGLTTLVMAVALWELMFKEGTNILLVSRRQDDADKALGLIDSMIDFLPDWLLPLLPVEDAVGAREHSWTFPSGRKSRIVSLAATKKSGASETATRVIWDEAALADYQSDTYRSVQPTTLAGGKLVVFSTARGGSNWFAKTFRQGSEQWARVFHPWMVSRLINPRAEAFADCPDGPCDVCVDDGRYLEIQDTYKDEPWKFFAEYPSSVAEAFRKSGAPRFSGLLPVDQFEGWTWRGRIDRDSGRLVEDESGPILGRHMLLYPPAGIKPVIAVDPATGTAGDYSVATIGWIDSDGTPQVAGIWRSNVIEPAELARDVACIGTLWGGRDALVAVEKQGGYGDSTIQELRNLGYRNLYVHRYAGHRAYRRDTTFGFPMTAARRPATIDRLAEWVPRVTAGPGEEILGLAPEHHEELAAFVRREDGRVAADDGMHDDLVMSLAIWLYVLLEQGGQASGSDPAVPGEVPQQQFNLSQIFERAGQIRQVHERGMVASTRRWERKQSLQARKKKARR